MYSYISVSRTLNSTVCRFTSIPLTFSAQTSTYRSTTFDTRHHHLLHLTLFSAQPPWDTSATKDSSALTETAWLERKVPLKPPASLPYFTLSRGDKHGGLRYIRRGEADQACRMRQPSGFQGCVEQMALCCEHLIMQRISYVLGAETLLSISQFQSARRIPAMV